MLEHNGKMYARVSDVIRPFGSFGHIAPDVLANKARIGTRVHEAIADDLSGQFSILDREISGYFYSYCKWHDHIKPTFQQFETRYFSDSLMLTGQIDALILMPDEKIPVLLDFKTSVSESPVTWNMQAHLYHMLLKENNVEVGDRFIFLRLNKVGLFPVAHCYSFDPNIQIKCMHAIENFWESDKK